MTKGSMFDWLDSIGVVNALEDLGFFNVPASISYHLNHTGGNFEHSLNVANTLDDLTVKNNLKWMRPESPRIVGIFHDLCKADDYIWIADATGNHWKHNPNRKDGHGYKSVKMVSEFFRLTIEETVCIAYHMGAFTPSDEWNTYTDAVHKYPNVLWTHHADMLAAHTQENRA